MLPDFEAIIFDMDGLVLDTESTYQIAWQQAAIAMGYQFSDEFCLSMTGLHSEAVTQGLLEYCGADFDLKQFAEFSGNYWRSYVQQYGIKQKPGLDLLLEVIKKHHIPFCLATNSAEINARECLEWAGLENTFKLIVSRDHVKHGKPEPDIFFKAAESLQCPISNCLVLEDSITGIKAARKAGAYSFLIPSQKQVSTELFELCDAVFNNLAEVAEIICANFP